MDHDQAQGGAKKKRAYAAQAYEFGGNAAGQLPSQGPPPVMGGPAMGVPYSGGAPAMGGFTGGAPAMPPTGAPSMGAPTMGQQPIQPTSPELLSSQFAQMNVQPQAPQPGQAPPQHMNQLFPSDLISQPFNVQELDLPPPPIILPPNVSDVVNTINMG
jgi:protein transport protein SEC24